MIKIFTFAAVRFPPMPIYVANVIMEIITGVAAQK